MNQDEYTKLLASSVDSYFLAEAVNRLQQTCHADNAHWWIDPKTGADLRDNPLIVPAKLALVHSEVSEALEAHRKGLADDHLPHLPGIAVELADALIRIFDLAGAIGIDLARALVEKRRYNAQRADHKTENRVEVGGKAY